MTLLLRVLVLVAVVLALGSMSAEAKTDSPRSTVQEMARILDGPRGEVGQLRDLMNFRGFDGTRNARQELPEKLAAVLDARGLLFEPETAPSDEDATGPNGDFRYLPFPDALPEFALERYRRRWLIAPDTLEAIPRLYDQTFSFGFQKLAARLPNVFHQSVFGVASWKYLFLGACLLISVLVGLLVEFVMAKTLSRIARLRKGDWGDNAILKTRRPFTVLTASLMMQPLVPQLMLPGLLSRGILFLVSVVTVATTVVIAVRVVDVIGDILAERAAKTASRLDDQLVPLVRRSMKTALVLMALLFILQNLNIEIASLLAGLGLGGLAFALAAKDTVANLFGSVMIFLDRPFQIGDWVILKGVEGMVEEVGFRSTRIRTFYKSLVTIPNSEVATATIDNMGERNLRRLSFTVGITYDTAPDQVQAFVEGTRAILQASPLVWHDYYEVHFRGFGASSLDIMVYAFLDVDSWTQELTAKHNINLELLRLARELDVDFAFPSTSLYVETTPDHPERPHERPPSLAEVVQGFGPQGQHAKPTGEAITHGYWPKPR